MSVRPKRKAVKKTNKGLATIRVASHTETVLLMPPGPAWKQPNTEKISPTLTSAKKVSSDFFQIKEAKSSKPGQLLQSSKDCCLTEVNSSSCTFCWVQNWTFCCVQIWT